VALSQNFEVVADSSGRKVVLAAAVRDPVEIVPKWVASPEALLEAEVAVGQAWVLEIVLHVVIQVIVLGFRVIVHGLQVIVHVVEVVLGPALGPVVMVGVSNRHPHKWETDVVVKRDGFDYHIREAAVEDIPV